MIKFIFNSLIATAVCMAIFLGASYAFGSDNTKSAIAASATDTTSAIFGRVQTTLAPITPTTKASTPKVDDLSQQVNEVKASTTTYNQAVKDALQSVDGWDPNVVEKVEVPKTDGMSWSKITGLSDDLFKFYSSFQAPGVNTVENKQYQVNIANTAMVTFLVCLFIALLAVSVKYRRS